MPVAMDSVRRVLESAWGARVRLGPPEALWRREHVVRVPVLASDQVPASVIVKTPRDADAAGSFAAELAAIELVGAGDAPVSARFVAASADPPLLVMEDVHGGPSLADLLLGGDRDAAAAALVTFAEGIADLHLAGIASVDAFEHRVRGLGHDPSRSSFGSFTRRRTFWEQQLDAAGIAPRRAADDLDAVHHALLEPGELRGIVHGDPCPDNVRFVDGRLRVFDFEWASAGHVLLDGVYLSLPFPTCWCVASLPVELTTPAEAAYRARLGIEDPRWDHDLVLVWAAWLVATTATLLGRVAEDEVQTWGTTTYRARIAGRLERFARRTTATGSLPGLTGVVGDLHEAMTARWSADEAELPAYPAFAGHGERVATPPEWWFEGA